MGYGYPARSPPSSRRPSARWFALCGDGDFLMTGQEIATAAQYGANFVTVVVNNGLYGTIRMHQEREYPGRVYGTELNNPDFAAYARAPSAATARPWRRTEDFAPAFERASKSGKPALIELRHRSGRDHADDHALGHPGEGAYVKAMKSGSAWCARSKRRKS